MARRITIKSFAGMKNGENSFYSNLTPVDDGKSLTSLTNVVYRKQKGMTGVSNLSLIVAITTAAKER